MRRPVIGIGAALESARWTVWETQGNVSQRSYSRAITSAGAQAVLLPAHDELAGSPDEVLDLLDALVLAGGSDIDPATYGAEPEPETGPTSPERDRFELALARRALERELPLLAVCRGMQLLNVACGGTLMQRLPDPQLHMHTPGRFADHEVELEPGSLAARATGVSRVSVRSHHHQGIARLGGGLEVSGHSIPDRAIESIEHPGHPFALGVLWHPEEQAGPEAGALFSAVVEAAQQKVAA